MATDIHALPWTMEVIPQLQRQGLPSLWSAGWSDRTHLRHSHHQGLVYLEKSECQKTEVPSKQAQSSVIGSLNSEQCLF